jgi:hypothetical protein
MMQLCARQRPMVARCCEGSSQKFSINISIQQRRSYEEINSDSERGYFGRGNGSADAGAG